MPFQSSHPIERAGKTFPYLGLSLITNPQFKTQSVGAQVVFIAYPYRIDDDGNVERPMIEIESEDGPVLVVDASLNKTVVFGDAYASAASDADLEAALTTIGGGLQAFVNAKGW